MVSSEVCTGCTAEEVFGRVGNLQPDWFRESLEALQPLLVARNAAYSRWVRTGNMVDLSKFRVVRNASRRASRKAKLTGSIRRPVK